MLGARRRREATATFIGEWEQPEQSEETLVEQTPAVEDQTVAPGAGTDGDGDQPPDGLPGEGDTAPPTPPPAPPAEPGTAGGGASPFKDV